MLKSCRQQIVTEEEKEKEKEKEEENSFLIVRFPKIYDTWGVWNNILSHVTCVTFLGLMFLVILVGSHE